MNQILFSIKNYFLDWKKQPLSAFLLILIFSFLGFKAASISFTWDEAASYLYFVQYNTWKPYETGIIDANNHLMNTLFMILEGKYLPKSVFYLRIHSLFSFLIYAGSAFSISKGLVKQKSVFILFSLLIIHPYFLDFFTLARGYAMSFAFEMLALALLLAFISKSNSGSPFLIAMVSCFAVLCNFSLLNFQLAIVGVTSLYCFYLYFQKIWSLPKLILALLPGWFITAVFFSKLFPLLFKMKELGNFYFGGSQGFWKDTVNSLVVSLSYNTPWIFWVGIFLKFIVISVFLIVPVWLIYRRKNLMDSSWKKLFAVYIILVVMISSTIIQHHYLNTLYLIERTALLFLPVFLVVTIIYLTNTKLTVIKWGLFAFFSFHLVSTISASSVFEWKMNSNNDKAIALLSKLPIPEGRSQINLSSSFEYFSVLKFYCQYFGITTIAPLHMNLNDIDCGGDYFVFPKLRKSKLNLPEIIEIYHDSISDLTIAKRREPHRNKTVTAHYMVLNNIVTLYDKNTIQNDSGWTMKPENMYSNGFKITLDSITSRKNAFVEMDILLKITSPLTKEIGIAYSAEREPLNLDYKYCELYSILNNKVGSWVHVKYSYPLPSDLRAGDVVSSFLFNNNLQHIAYKQYHFSIFNYQKP